MGYTSKDIAIITEPRVISLSASPNFVTFASKAAPLKSYFELNIQVKIPRYNLFNPATAIPNHYAGWTPAQTPNPPYDGPIPDLTMSDWIPARELTPYTLLNTNGASGSLTSVVFYDVNKDRIFGYNVSDGPSAYFTTPANTKYLRINVPTPAANPAIVATKYGLFLGPNPQFVAYSNTATETNIGAKTRLIIKEPSGAVHTFEGTTDPDEVTGQKFYISWDNSDTAENLRQALIANRWIRANMEVRIPSTWVGGSVTNGVTLNLKSKGTGAEFNIDVTAPNNTANIAYVITQVNGTSVNDDSISGEAATAEIELDIYTDAELFLGQDDRPISPETLGHYATTLSKTYAGAPLWFELNALFSQYAAFNVPPGTYGWFDTGTSRTYRFIAKKRGVNSFAFYQSNALFVLNGYGYASENLDLNEYTYLDRPIKLLTNKPRTTYMRGQKEFLNFIFSDPQRGISAPSGFSLGVMYRVYSTSDTYLGSLNGPSKPRADLAIVNTFALDMDAVLDAFPSAGIIRVALCRGAVLVSNDLEYTVRPECYHTLNQVVFLNRLGGWDAFNFDAPDKDEIKVTTETFNKTLTPGFVKGDSVETVYSTSLDNPITIEGAPVSDDVAEWLKELAAARVILDGEGNYIIKEDFTLQVTATAANMQIPTIKYRLSETYTND